MKHTRLGVSLALGALIAAGLMVSPASAATTTGTWTQYPTGATEYQAEVQQPINSANTSNWNSKSKGAIPVMFKLSSRTGPAAFESIYSDNTTTGDGGGTCGTGSQADHANDCAFMSFTPSPGITFNQITNLSTNYQWVTGDCHGGSLRWSVRTSSTQSVFIYYGSAPQFGNGGLGGCNPANVGGVDQSGTNMIGQPDLRYDTSQYPGGTFYDSYAHAQALVGTAQVIRASLVLDSGWGGDQKLNVSNTTVNDNAYQFVSSGGGAFTPTCNLPPATIEVSKNDPVASGDINEAPVQSSLVDDGNAFRVVDCKYQYILSIPSLQGSGTYEVQIWINGVRVPTPASPGGKVKFDIK
jgi:hypothetical protein